MKKCWPIGGAISLLLFLLPHLQKKKRMEETSQHFADKFKREQRVLELQDKIQMLIDKHFQEIQSVTQSIYGRTSI